MACVPALILFDIDGTLVRRAGPHHRRALEEALWREVGVRASTEQIPVQGMLDRDILNWMMRDAGISTARARSLMPAVVRRAQSLYVRWCPDLTRKVCPGVRPLLRRLDRRGALMGLVTGNLSLIGWKKMERAGLRRYFTFGAFAESASTRALLARRAVREARKKEWIARATPIALIGDHPNDIVAARANGLRSIAVATGLVAYEELRRHSPDVLVADLRELPFDCLWS